MIIRFEKKEEHQEVENLIREAFWSVDRPGTLEHRLMHYMRYDPAYISDLSYVLEENQRIVAHIAYSVGKVILDQGGTACLPILGPLSVLPEFQNCGYGKELVLFTLKKAQEMGLPAVIVTGDPGYYSRFGFESATAHGIYYQGMERSDKALFFMIKIFDGEKVKLIKGNLM